MIIDTPATETDDPWDWSTADAGLSVPANRSHATLLDEPNPFKPNSEKAAIHQQKHTVQPQVATATASSKSVPPNLDDLDAAWATKTWPPFPHKDKPDYFPSFMARSALFKAGKTSNQLYTMTNIPAQNATLSFAGPRLTMKDKHIWETAVQVAKESSGGVGSPVEISLRDFAKRMGMNYFKGPALKAIWQSLERLAQARIQFRFDDGCSGIGSMLATAARRGDNFYIRINPDFAVPAFMGDRQFKMQALRRSALSSSLAQWLHDFFTTHTTSRDMDLKYLRGLAGYDGPKRNFPMRLRAALTDIEQSAPQLIKSFAVEEKGRDSDRWTLRVERGIETAQYKQPAKSLAPSRSGMRRGGVAL